MKKRRGLCLVMVFLLLFASTSTSYCQSIEEENVIDENAISKVELDYSEFVISEWNVKDGNADSQKGAQMNIPGSEAECSDLVESGDKFFHNNGNPISTDIFVDNKNEGNFLVAVYVSENNGVKTTTQYFTNEPEKNLDALVDRVTSYQKSQIVKFNQEPENDFVKAAAASNRIVNKSFEYKESGYIMAVLSTSISFTKKSATVDNNPGSVWDVISFSQLEKKHATGLNEFYTRLSVAQPNQSLIDWGPQGPHSPGSVTFSLGLTGPAASYTFDLVGGKMEDTSSKSGKYGRWRCYKTLFGNPTSLQMEPGIRATNTSGSFVLEYSHRTNINALGATEKEYTTGVIQEWVPDR